MRKYYLLIARLARNAQDAQDKQLKNPAHDFRFADEGIDYRVSSIG